MSNLISVSKTTSKAKKNKSVKRMSVEQIYQYLDNGVKVPKLPSNELVQMNMDILFGTDAQLGINSIQVAVMDLLKTTLTKVGVHPKDADEFIEELPDGWDGTTEASEILYDIFQSIEAGYAHIIKAA
jgi:hypothetical protein